MKQKTSKWTRKNGFVNKVRDLLSRYERKPSKFAIEEENSFCNKEFSGSEKRLDEVTQSSVDINWVVRRENFIAQLDTIVKNLSKILEAQQDLVELIKQIRLCSKEIASIYISLKNLTEGNPSILRDRGSDLKLLQKYIVEMVTSLNHYKEFTSWVKIDSTNNPFLMPFNVFGQYSLVGLVDHISIDMKPWQYSNDLFVSIPASLMVTATQFLEFHKLSEAVKELYLSWNDEQFFMDKRLHRARILLNRSQKAIDKDPVLRYLLSAESNDRTILDEKGKIQKVSDMKFLSFSAANVKRAYIGWRISFFRKVSLRRVCQIRAAIVSRQVVFTIRLDDRMS